MILKYQAWLDASKFEDTILGAVVRQPLKPSNDYVPDAPLRHNNSELVEGTLTDFLLAGSGASSRDASAALGSVAGVSWRGNTGDGVNLAGKLVRYRRLQQHGRFWERLRADPAVRGAVPGWVSLLNAWPPCLVVGVMTAEDVELDYSGAAGRAASGGLELPLATVGLAAAGVPPLGGSPGVAGAGGASAAVGSSRRFATVFRAKSARSSIFALELRVVTTGLFRRRELALKEGGPKVDLGRLAGDEGSSDDDEEDEPPKAEDLITDGFTDQEYSELKG